MLKARGIDLLFGLSACADLQLTLIRFGPSYPRNRENLRSYYSSQATFVYHAFTSLAFLSPLLGSLLADSFFGKFKVILWGSIIYVAGHVFLSFGAIPSLEYSEFFSEQELVSWKPFSAEFKATFL